MWLPQAESQATCREDAPAVPPAAGGWQKAFYTLPHGLTSPLLLSPDTPSRTPRTNYPQKR